VAFRGAFWPHEGIVLEQTDDSVVLAVENKDESDFRHPPFEILGSLLGVQYVPPVRWQPFSESI
jgi:hypothetical protein